MATKKPTSSHPPEQLLLNEIQLLLAEKRTYYALLRTGMAIFALPLTVVAFLIGTVEYHNLFDTSWLATLVITGLVSISMIGLYVAQNSSRKIHRLNDFVNRIKDENRRLAEIVI